ncbi:molybdopterin synthase sulfur carrier subunit isoform Mocs2A [Mortierella sp. GBAus27b]|nr:molybdopterin synthase sulfur carrier subunit isoform Mocs2A [Mortierella sp. GBAus27b]
MQQFTVLYFASAKDVTRIESEKFDWSDGIDAQALAKLLINRHPALEDVLKVSMFAVNMEYMEEEHWTLQPGDDVAVIPPVSGG